MSKIQYSLRQVYLHYTGKYILLNDTLINDLILLISAHSKLIQMKFLAKSIKYLYKLSIIFFNHAIPFILIYIILLYI